MGIWFAMFGAAAAEKFQRIVEVWAIPPPTSTIRSNFSATVAPNIANPIPILKSSTRASKLAFDKRSAVDKRISNVGGGPPAAPGQWTALP